MFALIDLATNRVLRRIPAPADPTERHRAETRLRLLYGVDEADSGLALRDEALGVKGD